MLRLVQVSACWRKYLTQRDQQIRSELQLHGVLIDQRQEEQVIQLSLRGCTETIDYAAWRLSRPLVHNWSAVVTRWGGDADGPKLQRLGQRQCNKTPGLLYCLAFQF